MGSPTLKKPPGSAFSDEGRLRATAGGFETIRDGERERLVDLQQGPLVGNVLGDDRDGFELSPQKPGALGDLRADAYRCLRGR